MGYSHSSEEKSGHHHFYTGAQGEFGTQANEYFEDQGHGLDSPIEKAKEGGFLS